MFWACLPDAPLSRNDWQSLWEAPVWECSTYRLRGRSRETRWCSPSNDRWSVSADLTWPLLRRRAEHCAIDLGSNFPAIWQPGLLEFSITLATSPRVVCRGTSPFRRLPQPKTGTPKSLLSPRNIFVSISMLTFRPPQRLIKLVWSANFLIFFSKLVAALSETELQDVPLHGLRLLLLRPLSHFPRNFWQTEKQKSVRAVLVITLVRRVLPDHLFPRASCTRENWPNMSSKTSVLFKFTQGVLRGEIRARLGCLSKTKFIFQYINAA